MTPVENVYKSTKWLKSVDLQLAESASVSSHSFYHYGIFSYFVMLVAKWIFTQFWLIFPDSVTRKRKPHLYYIL